MQRLEEERKATSRRIKTLEHRLTLRSTNIVELIGEKENMENTLRQREFEFEMLCQSKTQKIELLQQCISTREKEILDLKMHLQNVDSELNEANKLIPTLKEKLQRKSVELEKKSAKVQRLKRDNNDMQLLLDMEKRVLDNYLLQEAAADVSHDRYIQEVQVNHVIQNTEFHCLQ